MTKERIAKSFVELKGELALKNAMQAPSIEKIVISVGTGKRSKIDRHWNEFVTKRLKELTGQKPSARPAKQSIAGFKIRQGDTIGQQVTLRGPQMIAFADKLLHISLPRTKDFRGIKRSAVDNMGNLTIGIKEHTIFPETAEEELKDVFGMSITIVSSLKNKKDATRFFEYVGVPFQK